MKVDSVLEILDKRIENLERKFEAKYYEDNEVLEVVRNGLGERIEELKFMRDDIAKKAGKEQEYGDYSEWLKV